MPGKRISKETLVFELLLGHCLFYETIVLCNMGTCYTSNIKCLLCYAAAKTSHHASIWEHNASIIFSWHLGDTCIFSILHAKKMPPGDLKSVVLN